MPYHKDDVYLINWLGMVEVMNIEPKPGIPPSAGHLTELLTKLQAQPADVIMHGAYQDPKAAEWLGGAHQDSRRHAAVTRWAAHRRRKTCSRCSTIRSTAC